VLVVVVLAAVLMTGLALSFERDVGRESPSPSTPGFNLGPMATAVTLSSNGLGPTAISLAWTESGDAFFQSYTVQYSATSSNGPWTTLWSTTTKTQTSVLAYGFSPSTTYWWQVIDTDSFGSQASNQLQETQTAAATLSFTQPTSTSASFTWNNLAQYGGLLTFVSYTLYESVNGGPWSYVMTITSVSTTTYTLNGLSTGTTYYFYLDTSDGCTCGGSSFGSSSNVVGFGTAQPLSVSVTPHPVAADVGQSVSFTCSVTGGTTPYSYSWTFGDGSLGSGQTTSHTYSTAGIKTVTCTVSDAASAQASGTSAVLISPAPSVQVVSVPSSVDLGQSVSFRATAAGGPDGFTYSWTGLPLACVNSGTYMVTCTPSGTGTSTVTATVTDTNGGTATASTSFIVYAVPTLVLYANPSSPLIGQAVSFNATAHGGSGGNTFSWSGLPPGCAAAPSAASYVCVPSTPGTYNVTLTVTDSNGASAKSSVSVTVDAAFLGMPAVQGYALVGGVAAIVVLSAVVALLWSRRKRRTSSPPAQPPTPPPPPPQA